MLLTCAVRSDKERSSAAPEQALPSSVAGQSPGQLAQGGLPVVGHSRAAVALFEIAAKPSGAAEAGPEQHDDNSAEHNPPEGLAGAPLLASDVVMSALLHVCGIPLCHFRA